MYIQLRLEETPAFRHLEEQQEGNETQQRSPVLEVIREHPKQILLAGVLSSSSMGHSISSSAASWTMAPGAWDCLATRC